MPTPTEAEIEAAARAIREVFARRIYDAGMEPNNWESLKPWQREGYREEARAALEAVDAVRADPNQPGGDGELQQ